MKKRLKKVWKILVPVAVVLVIVLVVSGMVNGGNAAVLYGRMELRHKGCHMASGVDSYQL